MKKPLSNATIDTLFNTVQNYSFTIRHRAIMMRAINELKSHRVFAKKAEETMMKLAKELDAKQAKIDELMFEYCPDEMTTEQIAEYEKHVRVSPIDNKQ